MENEAIAAAVASKSTYAGAGSMILGWMFSSEAAVLLGMVIGLAGLAVNWYYKAKTDQREQREHEARMRKLKTKPGELE